MKKIMFAFVVGLSVAAVAAVNDTLLMFSTQGPDKYADGTTVLDGECYALCYVQPSEGAFEIKSDGTAVGGEVLLVAPVAKGGQCPNLLYVVDAAKAESLTGGSYAVYLLDTRTSKAAGAALANGKDGAALVVNGAGAVVKGGTTGTEATDTIAQLPAAPNGCGAVQVASVIDQPKITAIKVEGANIKLTVADLSPAANYQVVTGTGVSGVSTPVAATVEGSTFTVSKDAGQFFKVIGTRKVAQ